jgi:hypothetical protein
MDLDKITFFKTMHGDIDLLEFEKWIYKNKDLENTYLDLIELNYKKSGVRYELFKKLEAIVSLGEYQKWKLLTSLDNALLKDEPFHA